MVERRLRGGSIAYYWRVRAKDRAAGFPIDSEVLGADYATAVDRAKMLNAHYDSWRQGRYLVKDLDQNPRFGSVGWLFEHYRQSRAFERVSERSRPEYLRALKRIEDLPTRTGAKLAELAVASISARAADKIYDALQTGPRGRRIRQANLSVDVARRAWKIVRRLYPRVVPLENPFEGILKINKKQTKSAATRAEAYSLATALKAIRAASRCSGSNLFRVASAPRECVDRKTHLARLPGT
jgi:hypothetical protein